MKCFSGMNNIFWKIFSTWNKFRIRHMHFLLPDRNSLIANSNDYFKNARKKFADHH